MRKHVKKSKVRMVNPALALLLASVIAAPALMTSSESAFTDTSTATISAKSDTLIAPSSLKLRSLVGGQTELTWAQSPSTYTTGYKILRSTSIYGPWTEIGSVQGRATTSFIDTKSGTTQWNYRVEATWDKWVSTSPGFEAPPAVGRTFYDNLLVAGSLDKRATEDGSSIWQVWSGQVVVDNYPGWGWGAQGRGYSAAAGPAIAVVRTPAKDAKIYIADLDGSEGVVLRGKDPKNYIYVGGKLGGPSASDGTFEIAKTVNGVRTVLLDKPMGRNDVNARIEIKGDEIKVFFNAINGVDGSGTLHASLKTDYLMNDPDATYFGIGFTKEWLIRGFFFEAI